MQEALERFADEFRRQQKKRHLTQMQLAEKLGMNHRTIIHIENCKKVPGFDAVLYVARELNISLDPILFPDVISSGISKNVADFFRDKDEAEIQKYIALRHAAEAIHADKSKIGV